MDTDENPRVTVETRGNRTLRTTVWNIGTWDERVTVELQQRCPQCGATWWTEEDPRRPVAVTCRGCEARQAEQIALAAEEEARRLRIRRYVLLIPIGCLVGGWVLSILAAVVAGLVKRL